MEPVTVGWIMVVGVVLLLFSGLPVAFALFIAGAIGHILVVGFGHMVESIPIVFVDKMSTYSLAVVPLFILMGFFASRSGFADDAFEAARKWAGHLPGGLAQATVAAGVAFAAACGTSLAACAAFSKIAIPPMRESGINYKLAMGVVMGAAPLSVLIPPSVIFPMYAIVTEQSIGRLLIAGIIPGLILAVVMMVMIFLMVKFRPELAPLPVGVPWRERFVSLKRIWGIAIVFIAVLGSIYSGIITPTEAGAVGAVACFLVGVASRRLGFRNGILPSLYESIHTSSSILIICVCALYFGHFLAVSRLPQEVSSFLVNLPVPRLIILLGTELLLIGLGCIIDTLAILFLTMPIMFPAMIALGYDPIWYGVVVVQTAELGLLTPPFGLNLFVLRGALKDVNMGEIISSAVPFMGAYVVALTIFIAFPQLSLWLPGMMMGK
jgi:C4-dicarboxylate transporter DctM subunit